MKRSGQAAGPGLQVPVTIVGEDTLMQLIKGAAVCGLAVAAFVAGGSVATPAPAGTVSPDLRPAVHAPTGGQSGGVLPWSAPARAAPAVPAPAVPAPAGSPPIGAAPAGDEQAGGAPAGSRPAATSPASAARSPAVPGWTVDCRPTPPSRQPQQLDGFVLGWVPPGLGPLVTDFEYEWDDVGFRSRVWESGPYPDESYRVDLQVTVMRSPSFTDVAALREFLVEYLERDPAAWATEPFAHPDGPGLAEVGELFWLARPGVAVRVFGGGEQLDHRDLTRTACAVRAPEAITTPILTREDDMRTT